MILNHVQENRSVHLYVCCRKRSGSQRNTKTTRRKPGKLEATCSICGQRLSAVQRRAERAALGQRAGLRRRDGTESTHPEAARTYRSTVGVGRLAPPRLSGPRVGARVASLRSPILLSSLSSVRQLFQTRKRKFIHSGREGVKSRGALGGGEEPPIISTTSSLSIGAEIERPVRSSRAPGADADAWNRSAPSAKSPG